MLEIPEASTLARQIDSTLTGKKVQTATAAFSPHKFAWYSGDPTEYSARLPGNSIISSSPVGGMVEIELTHAHLLFTDGVNQRYHTSAASVPAKHQLLMEFSDGSAFSASVQMYGGLFCWQKGEGFDNPYYLAAREKPSPLSNVFDESYFQQLLAREDVQTLSLKAALATQQRIPGFGNGVLQDVLWKAGLSPRCKVSTLSQQEIAALFTTLKETLSEMTRLGGRDSEKDLFGNPGGYVVVMSAKNKGSPCPVCDTPITKEAYLGGSVYYCRRCQRS